jgi:hypothetical protein
MSFNDTTAKIDEVVSNFNKLANDLQMQMREEIKKVFSSFFEEFPQVKTIHWTQYTPYFNDGEECTFGFGDIRYTTTEHTELGNREHVWGEGDDGLINDWGKTIEDQKLNSAIKTMCSLLNSEVMGNVLKTIYGDHVWVKVHKDGADVEDFEHD